MTPHEWNVAIGEHVPASKAFAIVRAEVRAFLGTLADGHTLNTAQLVEALYPATAARGPEVAIRARIYNALSKGVQTGDLADCMTRDEANARKRYGRKITPWLWHKPEPKRCPHCGGLL